MTDVLAALREWQADGAPFQLHPGDVGWFGRFGPAASSAAVRSWERDGRVVAAGLLDGADLIRLTIAPDLRRDAALARELAGDLTDPSRGMLGPGKVAVEVPRDALVRSLLAGADWRDAEPWTPLTLDLSAPVPDPGLRVEVTGPATASVRTAVQRASFEGSTFTDERWAAMAAGPAYADARCLVGYAGSAAVAAVTVWSAGPGRPGLIEPLGVHRDHRGRGHGRAITLAAAATLRDLGSSSALVCTPSRNTAAVATYAAAGFTRLPEVADLHRPA